MIRRVFVSADIPGSSSEKALRVDMKLTSQFYYLDSLSNVNAIVAEAAPGPQDKVTRSAFRRTGFLCPCHPVCSWVQSKFDHSILLREP